MRLPFAERARVPERKIRDYLLNPAHLEGGPKARFFLAAGYDPHDSNRFRDDLLSVGRKAEMQELPTRFGPKYVGSGLIASPSGTMLRIRTVWLLPNGVPPPTLVTAYPF